jgi:hypothetical protein
VKRFLYPERHTVDVNDLHRPGLLESVEALEGAVERLGKLIDETRPS